MLRHLFPQSLRGSANSRPTLRNGTTGTRTRSPSATSFKGASPAVAPTRLFQPRSNEASSHLATTRAGVVPSTSRVTATAHSPKRKISQSLVVQVRPRSGSFTNGTPGPLSAGAGAMTSPGRGKATVRQTSTGPAVRKRSGPLATTPTPVVAPEPEPVQAAPTPPPPPPAPQVEEEYVADNPGQVPREVVCTAFDENNAVMCFGNAEEWDIHRCGNPQDLGGATTLILKLTRKLSYEELLTALRGLCSETVPESGTSTFDFVHLPWKKLAVVNFTSPEICVRCYSIFFTGLRNKGSGKGLSRPLIVDLKPAEHQGLVNNLAFWCIRSMNFQQNQPRVFCEGNPLDLIQACLQLVPAGVLEQVDFSRACGLEHGRRVPHNQHYEPGVWFQSRPSRSSEHGSVPETGVTEVLQSHNVRRGEHGELIFQL
eukprot:symbB.v1.2.031911.t1/scaffold3757.1/size50859/3